MAAILSLALRALSERLELRPRLDESMFKIFPAADCAALAMLDDVPADDLATLRNDEEDFFSMSSKLWMTFEFRPVMMNWTKF